MLPVLEGIISRRILLNFRCDPATAQKLIPPPLEVETHRGFAIAGVCLIRLEQLRPKGLPKIVGVSSENMAHRIAIRFPTEEGMKPGVFIWRRETDQKLVQMLGGRAFPGVHSAAQFHVSENAGQLTMEVRTEGGQTDVAFAAKYGTDWRPTPAFSDFPEVSEFFKMGDCGFSCSLRGDELEGMQLRTLRWEMSPLEVQLKHCVFFANNARFPSATVEFDCGLLMRGLPHEWHELNSVPEFASSK